MIAFQITHPSPPSAAFFLKKKKNSGYESSHSNYSQTPAYRIFYNFDASNIKKGLLQGSEADWIELNYKISLTDENQNPFLQAQGGKVRFYDQDGFIVASDLFLAENFQKSDLYKSFWVEKNRMKSVRRADAINITPDELEKLRKEAQSKVKVALEEAHAVPPTAEESAIKAEKTEESVRSENLSAPAPEADIPAHVETLPAAESSSEQPLAASPAPSPSPILEEGFKRQSITNEDVQKTLNELIKQAPTEMFQASSQQPEDSPAEESKKE